MEKINLMNDYSFMMNSDIIDVLGLDNVEKNLLGYENDIYSKELETNIKKLGYKFCRGVSSGTGGNILSINSIVSNHGSIIVSSMSHIYRSEMNGPFSLGIQPLVIEADNNAKINFDDLPSYIDLYRQNTLHSTIEAISVTFPTENGAVYSIDELKKLRKISDEYGLKIHIDGARIFNGLEKLGIDLRQFQEIVNADVTLIGGNKMGILFGELVAYNHSNDIEYVRRIQKKLGQQMAKGFIISMQFNNLLFGEQKIWEKISYINNNNMDILLEKIKMCKKMRLISQESYTNICFVEVYKTDIDKLMDNVDCSIFEDRNESVIVRFVTNVYSNTKEIDFNSFM